MKTSKIAGILMEEKKIAIISHLDPDGDALGSQLALARILEKEGKEVLCFNASEIPEYLFFLAGIENIQPYQGQDLSDHVLVYVDCADSKRTGMEVQGKISINIDHHVSNDLFADYNLIIVKAAATGEIVYQLIRDMGLEIDQETATALYTALSTDTGSFMFANTRAESHRIAADLIERGADVGALRENFFEGVTLRRFKMTRYAYQEAKFACDNKLAWVKLPYDLIKELDAREEDSEGVAGHLRNIKDVEVALLLKEREDGKIKGSLRGKDLIDVSKIARTFGGGGHRRASGFEVEMSLDQAEEELIKAIKEELKNV